jgi:ribosome-associated protein
VRDVPIRDEVIRLGQLLKYSGLVDSGTEAKLVLTEGLVQVNGEPEARRGRQLRAGDVVALEGADEPVRVTPCPSG